jgi:hypothetical protein
MGMDTEPSDLERHYSQVRIDHADHTHLRGALRAYEQLIASHPDTREARRARDWIRHIKSLSVHLVDGRVIPVGDVLAHRWDRPHAEPRDGWLDDRDARRHHTSLEDETEPMNADSNRPDNASAAARDYAVACASHYGDRDLPAAVRAYAAVVVSHAGTPEEGYARTQIGNIVRSVVPVQDLLTAHVDLVLRHGLPTAAAARAAQPS